MCYSLVVVIMIISLRFAAIKKKRHKKYSLEQNKNKHATFSCDLLFSYTITWLGKIAENENKIDITYRTNKQKNLKLTRHNTDEMVELTRKKQQHLTFNDSQHKKRPCNHSNLLHMGFCCCLVFL